jgi:hypothetical protein
MEAKKTLPSQNTWNPYLKFYQETVAKLPEAYERCWNHGLNDEDRDKLLQQVDMDKASSFAWAIPDELAMKIISHYSPIVEVGAGLGYWARCMRERGIEVTAYDIHVSPFDGEAGGNCEQSDKIGGAEGSDPDEQRQGSFPRAWTNVERGGPDVLRHVPSTSALFLCYPDDFEESEESMADSCLDNFVGDTVIHVGEWLGASACRPNPWGRSSGADFQMRLSSTFHKILQIPLPCWSAGFDCLSVWKRTSTCIYEGEIFADIPPSERLNLTMVSPSTAHLIETQSQSQSSNTNASCSYSDSADVKSGQENKRKRRKQ